MNQSLELTTKEKILDVSIDLFAQKGFKDVTVREIAEAVGIKASSLYKHYESKEDILESIFVMFKEKIGQTVFPKEELRQYINTISPERYLNESFDKFKQVMWALEVVKIAKIITIEQQRNQSVRQFFVREFIENPNKTMQYAFELMQENGSIEPTDTRVLAEEYNSYIVSLYFEQNFLRENLSLDEIEIKMKQHNDFYAHHVLTRKEENKDEGFSHYRKPAKNGKYISRG